MYISLNFMISRHSWKPSEKEYLEKSKRNIKEVLINVVGDKIHIKVKREMETLQS